MLYINAILEYLFYLSLLSWTYAGTLRSATVSKAENVVETVDVLAVDDEQVNLLLLSGLLRRQGVNVVTARSGFDALKLMAKHDFALILMDVMMPGMDGFTTAERIRADETTRHIPIIFVTAISKEQRHVFKGYETGAVDYLIKPFEHDILKSKVQVFVEMHRQPCARGASPQRP